VKVTWKFFGASALKLIVASRPLSFATVTRYLKDVVAVPRSEGKLVESFSLAGSSCPTVTAIGNLSSAPSPLAATRKRYSPGPVPAGGSSRSCSFSSLSGATIADSTGWPPPRTVAFQPLAISGTESDSSCGGRLKLRNEKSIVVVSPARTVNAGYRVVR
jgi:hypothetical protein